MSLPLGGYGTFTLTDVERTLKRHRFLMDFRKLNVLDSYQFAADITETFSFSLSFSVNAALLKRNLAIQNSFLFVLILYNMHYNNNGEKSLKENHL